MRKINFIVVHCTATVAGRHVSAAEVDQWHRQRGFDSIGYHYLVDVDGYLYLGRPEEEVGAHAKGVNKCSIGVAYAGGLDAHGDPADTRTPQQKATLRRLLTDLHARYPEASIVGHRELAAKACPCFDAAKEYADL